MNQPGRHRCMDGVVPNFDPCQIITPLVLVGLGLGVCGGGVCVCVCVCGGGGGGGGGVGLGVGLGLGNQIFSRTSRWPVRPWVLTISRAGK